MVLRASSFRPVLRLSYAHTARLSAAAATAASASFQRTMASSAPKKIEWLIIIPDKPGMKEKRLEVRPAHFEGLKPLIETDEYKMGGAILNDAPTDSNPANYDFAGSTIVRFAETREEIIKDLRDDIYARSGVWDVDNAQIYPFICGFRKAQ